MKNSSLSIANHEDTNLLLLLLLKNKSLIRWKHFLECRKKLETCEKKKRKTWSGKKKQSMQKLKKQGNEKGIYNCF